MNITNQTIRDLPFGTNKDYFVKGTPANAKEKLDKIGGILGQVFKLEREKIRIYRVLLKMYLADCKRLGVAPVDLDRGIM